MRASVAAFLASTLWTSAAIAAPDDDAVAKARAFFDDDPADERSMTRKVHDFLALDPAIVRGTLAEVWELQDHHPSFENVLRFLHGIEPRLLTTSFGRRGWTVVG